MRLESGVVTIDRHVTIAINGGQLGTLRGVQSGDHLAVTHVDTNVVVTVGEHDVARLGVRGCAKLSGHGVGVRSQLDALLSKDVGDEAGAVPCTVGANALNVTGNLSRLSCRHDSAAA